MSREQNEHAAPAVLLTKLVVPDETRSLGVSVLSDAGIDMEAIADAAGHSSSSVTRTVYRHQISPVVARATAAMDDIFGTGRA